MGRISDKVGKKPVIIVSSICGFAGYGLSWFASKHRPWLFFVIMVLLGIAGTSILFFHSLLFFLILPYPLFLDAGYNTQMYAVMGIYQPKKTEAAYACMYPYLIYLSLSFYLIYQRND